MHKIKYATRQIWRLMVPDSAAGAGRVFFDLFNATSGTAGTGQRIIVSSVKTIVAGDVDVTGVVACNLHLHKTTSAGTGGTAATLQGVVNTAATFSTLTPDPGGLPAGITARAVPTGAAAIGAWVSQTSVFTEETNSGSYAEKWLLHPAYDEAIVLGQGQGLKVIQGTVASVGNIGHIVTFGLLEQ